MMIRRKGLVACMRVLVMGASMLWAIASAQPDVALRIVVPTPAGGPLDAIARSLAIPLAKSLNGAVIVENKAGAAGMIGTDYVARAAPDGRTVLLASGFVVTNTLLYKVNYDPLRDFVPVVELSQAGMVMLARKGLDVRAPADLARAAAGRPGGLNCGAPPGEMALACEQLKQALGGAVVTVPYTGVAPAITALIGGNIDVMLAPFDTAVPWADGERAVAFATTGTRAALPPFAHLPLASASWPDFNVIGLLGILAPAGTPPDVVRKLNREFNAALKDASVREFMLARGSVLDDDSPPEKLGRTLAERLAYYRRLAASLGLKPQ